LRKDTPIKHILLLLFW